MFFPYLQKLIIAGGWWASFNPFLSQYSYSEWHKPHNCVNTAHMFHILKHLCRLDVVKANQTRDWSIYDFVMWTISTNLILNCFIDRWIIRGRLKSIQQLGERKRSGWLLLEGWLRVRSMNSFTEVNNGEWLCMSCMSFCSCFSFFGSAIADCESYIISTNGLCAHR